MNGKGAPTRACAGVLYQTFFGAASYLIGVVAFTIISSLLTAPLLSPRSMKPCIVLRLNSEAFTFRIVQTSALQMTMILNCLFCQPTSQDLNIHRPRSWEGLTWKRAGTVEAETGHIRRRRMRTKKANIQAKRRLSFLAKRILDGSMAVRGSSGENAT